MRGSYLPSAVPAGRDPQSRAASAGAMISLGDDPDDAALKLQDCPARGTDRRRCRFRAARRAGGKDRATQPRHRPSDARQPRSSSGWQALRRQIRSAKPRASRSRTASVAEVGARWRQAACASNTLALATLPSRGAQRWRVVGLSLGRRTQARCCCARADQRGTMGALQMPLLEYPPRPSVRNCCQNSMVAAPNQSLFALFGETVVVGVEQVPHRHAVVAHRLHDLLGFVGHARIAAALFSRTAAP